MNIVNFLSYLQSLDIQVWLDKNRLRCNAPEGTLTPELRAEISQRKVEIISFLTTANQTSNLSSLPLLPIARQGNLPLSFAQQRLWFLDRLIPNNPFYNVPAAVRLTGLLNLAALEQTFNEIVRRHEALRTTFLTVEGQPMQKIAPQVTVSLPIIDLQGLPTAQREAEMRRLTTQEAQKPFNLSTGPLLRLTLLRLEETEHLLVMNLHHIVSDGWSIGVLIRELGALYTAFASKNSVSTPLPELPIQYADFAHWQRQWLEEVGAKGYSPLQSQLAYWRQQLEDIPLLNLPSDRPRPAVQTYQGKAQRLQLSKTLSEALEALSQQEGVTLFMTLLTAFKTLLYRYTQQEDIVVGSPIANRNRSEIEGLIGFFVNSLVLRTDLSGNPTFRELLSRVKEVALSAYAHQDLPFEKLVEELEPERKLNQNPLFQVAFALQNAPTEAIQLPDLTLQPQQLDIATTRFDLEFHLWELSSGNGFWVDSSQGISGLIVYNTDLFNEATIVRMLGHFQTLLESIVRNPDGEITHLDILTEVERHQILVKWNDTQVNYPQDRGIHQLFEAQVEQTPDALAVVCGKKQLTYRELNIRSNQLAHYLKKLGVASEVLVGICVERSLEMIIGILAILKAGGAYVPLDPSYPQERLSFMLEDAQLPLLLTQQQWVQRLGKTRSQIICLDRNWVKIAQEKQDNLDTQVSLRNRAYVIYTSGSTGKPKGVDIEQGGLLNLIYWHQKTFHVSASDRVSQIFGMAFDACGWEIFPYLCAGASIHIADDEIRTSPEKLREWLIAQQITVSFIPTVITDKLLQLDWSNHTALRYLLTGGDKLNKYPARSHSFKLVNNYGPTENTVVTTSAILLEDGSEIVPTIGRSIANTQIYILDRNLQPVPIGIPGELYISGDGLARGYLNRPDLTAEKFISHPFSQATNTRLYKTGDLVRYREDGNLEFLGRIDNQVKIRGYRIELEEIETVLSQHPAVLQTVVIAFEDVQDNNRLVAYVALNSESSNTSEQTPLQNEQVLQWQMLYNETYDQNIPNFDPRFNIIGWNSSYTNQPIPVEQMREWVNHQVAQILALQPRRVLEIGCGTGLLLFRIAPHCREYWGSDFSAASLNYIQQQLAQQEMPQVKLLQQMATEFDGIEAGKFDTIILNSVVQYFPSVDYLVRVIEGAVKTLVSGGFIFIGDIRSLPLLKAFHALVQLEQAEPTLSREQLQQRVQMQMFEETELVIDPAFFSALKQRFPQIHQVQIQLMRGRYQNELTQFRYNVILEVGAKKESPQFVNPVPVLNWSKNQLKLSTVREQFVENSLEALTLTDIPNARVMEAIQTVAWLSGAEEFRTVSQMREAMQKRQDGGVDPEVFWDLGEELGYQTQISWSEGSTDGRYDVTFVRDKTLRTSDEGNIPLRPWHTYANNPLQAKAARKLVPQLQRYLSEKLPEYMVPSAFVVLESLPLTSNGKCDRHALPAPQTIQPEFTGTYVAPRTPVEETLAKIFAEVLGVKRVGIHDNFFELGGHSLLATQFASRVRDAFGVELPLRSIFESPTISELSQTVERLQQMQAQTSAPALVPISRESRRMKLSSLNSERSPTQD